MLKLADTEAFKSIGASPQDPFDVYTPHCDGYPQNSDEYWICRIKHYTYTVYHPTSTCRMGSKNDPTAVVDPQLRWVTKIWKEYKLCKFLDIKIKTSVILDVPLLCFSLCVNTWFLPYSDYCLYTLSFFLLYKTNINKC